MTQVGHALEAHIRRISETRMPTYVVFYKGAVYDYTADEPPDEGETIVLDTGGDTVRVTHVMVDGGHAAIDAEPLKETS